MQKWFISFGMVGMSWFQTASEILWRISGCDLEMTKYCPACVTIHKHYVSGKKSIFTEAWLRDRNIGVPTWVANLDESEGEGFRLYGQNYYPLRYEDLLQNPFVEMKKLWLFLGAKEVPDLLEKEVLAEVAVNPDEKWQAEKNNSIAPTLEKGKPGAWKNFFTENDRKVFKEIAGQHLIKWKYEKDLNW